MKSVTFCSEASRWMPRNLPATPDPYEKITGVIFGDEAQTPARFDSSQMSKTVVKMTDGMAADLRSYLCSRLPKILLQPRQACNTSVRACVDFVAYMIGEPRPQDYAHAFHSLEKLIDDGDRVNSFNNNALGDAMLLHGKELDTGDWPDCRTVHAVLGLGGDKVLYVNGTGGPLCIDTLRAQYDYWDTFVVPKSGEPAPWVGGLVVSRVAKIRA